MVKLFTLFCIFSLAQRILPILYPEPKTLEQKIGNIEIALQAFKEDGVECPGIFANGNQIKFKLPIMI